MKSQKLFIRILCIILCALILLSFIVMAIPARAVTQDEIDLILQKRELLEKQMEEQAQIVQSLEENKTLIIDRKCALDRQIELNREYIRLMEEELAAYDELILEKGHELELAQTAEEEQSVLFRARVRSMEEQGNYSYINYLFDSDSVSNLLSRLGDVRDVMHYDRKLEDDLQKARTNLEDTKRVYEQIQLEQSQIQSELNEKKELLDAQVDAACRLIQDLENRTDNAQQEYDAIEAAEKQAFAQEQKAIEEYAAQLYAAQLAREQAAQAAAQAEQAAAQAAQASDSDSAQEATSEDRVTVDGDKAYVSIGGYIWPVDSTYITSRYGPRIAPTAGASSYHQAIDISASGGSPVYAAAGGQVAVATYNQGLGNYVSIVHEDGSSTRYSHLSSYIVSPGQTVEQGQVIGYVGSTGIATGNHLDFAVIQNGEQVDPLQFYDNSALTFDPTA